MRVKRAGFRPSLNLLYALEGALLDCHWQEVPETAPQRTGRLPPKPPPPCCRRRATAPPPRPVTTTQVADTEDAAPAFNLFDEPAGHDAD